MTLVVGELVHLIRYPSGDLYGTVRETYGESATYAGCEHFVATVAGVAVRVWGTLTRDTASGLAATPAGLAVVEVRLAEAWVPRELQGRSRKPRAPRAAAAPAPAPAPADTTLSNPDLAGHGDGRAAPVTEAWVP